MPRPVAELGFEDHPARVSSRRLTNAVAASLAIASVSLCLIVALTMLTMRVSMAMPLPV